jgi:hypothetical protein
MMNLKFLSHGLDSTVNKMSPLVTHQNPWPTESSNHMLK